MGLVERATLVVLAEAADIGIPEAVSVPAEAFDPLLRGAIRRRAAAAVADAEQRTTLRGGDHVLRLAFLLLHPSAPKDLATNDEKLVSEAFDALATPLAPHLQKPRERRGSAYREAAADRAPDAVVEPARKRPNRFWPLTTPLSAAFVAGVVATAVVVAIPYWTPSPTERFRKTPFGEALDVPLTTAVAGARAGETRGHDALLSDRVTRQIGAPAHAELERLLATLPPATKSMGTADEAMAPVFASLNGLNARLFEAHVPALLHGYSHGHPGERSLWITSYFVERREEISFEGSTMRAVWGRRLDTLNLADSAAYKANAEDYVIVSLDVMEKSFVEAVLPALMREDAPSAPDSSARTTLERQAERTVGREVRALAHMSPSDAEELSGAIARRNLALEKVGHTPRPNIDLGPSARGGLQGDPFAEVRRLDDQMHMHRRKVAGAIAQLTELVEEGFLVRVRDEERFDSSIFPKLGESDSYATTRARVSSDLGSIARAPSPHLALWMVVRKVLYSPAGFERGPAETTLVLLLRELGSLAGPPPRVTEDALVNALGKAFEVDATKLKAAATSAYETTFVAPLPPFVRRVL